MRHRLLPAALALCVLAPPGHAQERGTLVIPEREPTEVMLLRASASSRCLPGCIVRNASYAGERVVEHVQVLADGNRIVERRAEQLYRDGEGRTRVESTWRDKPLVQIQDPVRNMSYRLYPEEKNGLGMAIGTPALAAGAASLVLTPAGDGAARVAQQLAPAIAQLAASADSQSTTRTLGTRQIEGLVVEGTLETSTIPAGKVGNALPIVSTTETWYSPDLKLALYVKSVDPRAGEHVTRVQHIRRGEPPARLFSVPADYTVRDIARR